MDDINIQSTLLVFGAIFYIVCYVIFQGLRTRLATVPHQAAAQQQQIAILTAEINGGRNAMLQMEEALATLQQDVDRAKTRQLEARQMLHEMQHRLPTMIYVLDQIIQNSYSPWAIIVRWSFPPEGVPEGIGAEMLRGRRMLVFADTPANVRRRIEARFPPGQGYHLGEPVPFEL